MQFYLLTAIFTSVQVFPYLILGGFKYFIFSFTDPAKFKALDWQLTVLGSVGALLVYLSRFVTQFIADKIRIDTRRLLIGCLLILFGCNAFARQHLQIAFTPELQTEAVRLQPLYALFLVTCICYGSLVSLVPLVCYRIFGPTVHQLLSFKMTREGLETSI